MDTTCLAFGQTATLDYILPQHKSKFKGSSAGHTKWQDWRTDEDILSALKN